MKKKRIFDPSSLPTRGKKTGAVRIFAGKWKRTPLPVIDLDGLRPTGNRIRETVFDWLTFLLGGYSGKRALDMFAGSGALGLEALSRYAASTTLLEMERGVAQQLQKNLATLKADRGKVIATNTLSFLSQPGTPHEIVFVDPPFRQGLLEETLRLLETQGWLADEALVYVESEVENGLPPVPANWHLYREKVAGQVAYRLYQREAQGENHAD